MLERVDVVRVGVSRSSRRDVSLCGDVAPSSGGELCALVAAVELSSLGVPSWRVEGGGSVASVIDAWRVESLARVRVAAWMCEARDVSLPSVAGGSVLESVARVCVGSAVVARRDVAGCGTVAGCSGGIVCTSMARVRVAASVVSSGDVADATIG